jgi:hypothetical protein
MNNIFLIILVCFVVSTNAFGLPKSNFFPIKSGQKSPFDGMVINYEAASKIMADLDSCEIKINQELELQKIKLDAELQFSLSMKESENKLILSSVQNDLNYLKQKNTDLYKINDDLKKSNKIKNYIIITMLSSFITYELVNRVLNND